MSTAYVQEYKIFQPELQLDVVRRTSNLDSILYHYNGMQNGSVHQ